METWAEIVQHIIRKFTSDSIQQASLRNSSIFSKIKPCQWTHSKVTFFVCVYTWNPLPLCLPNLPDKVNIYLHDCFSFVLRRLAKELVMSVIRRTSHCTDHILPPVMIILILIFLRCSVSRCGLNHFYSFLQYPLDWNPPV